MPLYHVRPSGAGHEILQGVAELLVRRRAMRSYETDLPLETNVAQALESWARDSGLFAGLRFLQCKLSLREFGFDWSYAGGTTPYVGFALQARSLEHVFVGPALKELHAFDPSLPAALMQLVSRGTDGVQVWDFPFLLYLAESYFWLGETDQASVLENLKAEIGDDFNPDEHLLPDEFYRDFPRWLFPQFNAGADLAGALRRFFQSPPAELAGVANTAKAFADGQVGIGRRLRTPYWESFCEGGCDLAPLTIIRMHADDCGGRIVDQHDENQCNGEGFVEFCGGYAGGAADEQSLARAWEQLRRQLRLLQRLDALLVELTATSRHPA